MRLDPATIDDMDAWFPASLLAEVQVVQSGPVCWFVALVLRQGALAFSPFVFYGRKRFNPADRTTFPLLAHEVKHVEQYRRLGHLGFLSRYLRDLAANRFRYDERLPLEVEAYALQTTVAQSLGVP
jgi:hypothetical protein